MTPLIFFGSDRYSAIALSHLLANWQTGKLANLTIVTDRHTDPSPVEKLAKTHNLKVAYYPTNQDEMSKFVSLLASWLVDTLPTGLCASFDHLIPSDLIAKFGGHLYNLHPSLLPQYRNVSPVQYAIALGDKTTGITLFRISPGIDDGEIIAQVSEPILPTDTTPNLTSRLFQKGAELFLSFLDNPMQIPAHHSEARQSEGWIFTRRLKRHSGYIEWPILHKLLQNQAVTVGESTNELLNLRLQKESATSSQLASSMYLLDLLRALTPWPTVWSTVPTKKGELRITLESVLPEIRLKIAGKPNSILLTDLKKYYLETD